MAFGTDFSTSTPFSDTEISLANAAGYLDIVRGAITKVQGPGTQYYTNTDIYMGQQGSYDDFSLGSGLIGNTFDTGAGAATASVQSATPSEMGDPRTNNEQLYINVAAASANNSDGSHFVPGTRTLGQPNGKTVVPNSTTMVSGGVTQGWPDYFAMPNNVAPYISTNAATAPAVIADGPLTSVGQLGDVFDPARLSGTAGINYSRGGGRTLKIGQHDDLYSCDPSTNVSNSGSSNTADSIPNSNSWAAWRLADVFDVANPIEKPGCININGVIRDNGAALSAALQGWVFQPQTQAAGTTASTDPIIHGAPGLAGQALDTKIGDSAGLSQIVAQIKARLLNVATPSNPSGPFFERGELGELGVAPAALFGSNPTASSSPNTALVSGSDMNTTFDHGREEFFNRIAEMICTRGDTFTVYAVGQSILQRTASGPLKVTGTHRVRVTFRLVPKNSDGTDFHPSYTLTSNGQTSLIQPNANTDLVNKVQPSSTNNQLRFAKPDHYDAQIIQTNNL